MFSKLWKKDWIRKGWHEWFAWYPVELCGEESFAWLRTVERKYYQTHGRTAVKKGLNEIQINPWRSLNVMYRPIGSNVEKTCYVTKSGTLWRDPKETVRGIPDREWDRIGRSLDALGSNNNNPSLARKYLRSGQSQPHEIDYMKYRGKL